MHVYKYIYTNRRTVIFILCTRISFRTCFQMMEILSGFYLKLLYVTYTHGKQSEKAKLHLSATIFSTRKALNIHAEKNVNFDEATKFFISVAYYMYDPKCNH